MGESRRVVEELLALCLQRITMEENNMNAELKFIEVVKNFESVQKKWLHAEMELKKYKELLVKSDVSKAALEVKLKHARNQLDVEMKKRYKIEADYQYLRQMQLMCDILVHDSKSSACLNDEQKSLLATFEHKAGNATLQKSSKRLSVIDESSFLSHSDISYDRTDDDVDLDTTVIKPLRSRARERRRSSMGPSFGPPVVKRSRGGNVSAELLDRRTVEKDVETIVKASLMTAEAGGQIHMVVGISQETPKHPAGTFSQENPEHPAGTFSQEAADQTSVWFPCDDTVIEPEPEDLPKDETVHACRTQRTNSHVFLSKTVIRPETCLPCGKRMRFGKMAVKCRNCRVVAHPECKQKFSGGCSASKPAARGTVQMDSLEGFAPQTHPRVPVLIVNCVAEIERRGLQERGLYRVPGGERLVKELRDRFLHGESLVMLSKVQDVHVVCGLLKDVLRKLKEPLLTFRLHRTFMEAAELADADSCSAIMVQNVSELPKANRDTLAFLMLHLHKVMRSPQCQMDQNNLARVFGPTIVGHGMSEPSPTTIMRDTNTQPKVVLRLLSLPEDYWRRILTIQMDQGPSSSSTFKMNQEETHGRLFKPVTSPELNSYYKTASRGNPRSQARNLGNAFNNTGRLEPGRRFFTSPS
ncbi:rac GTPase-activating protein 1 isoform X2 [Amphiprion ocellaris]|uniref:rac GTPase-activating protein 1 isoform X2 n=1 Tax=Amphiprion ocellaris TaxID=80972 RepID=UPI00241142A0|nr:rac GTPase-activating protein 1 isoform X2 [Amphiprion ocellaris]